MRSKQIKVTIFGTIKISHKTCALDIQYTMCIDTNVNSLGSCAICFFFCSIRFLEYFSFFLKNQEFSGNNMYYNDQQQYIIDRTSEQMNEKSGVTGICLKIEKA